MIQRLKNWLLAEYFPTVDPLKVITVSKDGIVYLDGEALSEAELRNLQAEVGMLQNLKIWDIFQNTIKNHAQQVMFEKSKDFDDMKSGKMMLYNLDVMDKIVKSVAKTRT